MSNLKCIKCGNELIYHFDNDLDSYEISPCECVDKKLDILRENDREVREFFRNINRPIEDKEINISDFYWVEKQLSMIDDIMESINKIIPEYKHVPTEYKVLLFKERINHTYVTSSRFNLNEEQIDKLATALSNKAKILFVKYIRMFLKVGLKDAKNIVEESLNNIDFNNEYDFNFAKKLIIERF